MPVNGFALEAIGTNPVPVVDEAVLWLELFEVDNENNEAFVPHTSALLVMALAMSISLPSL